MGAAVAGLEAAGSAEEATEEAGSVVGSEVEAMEEVGSAGVG